MTFLFDHNFPNFARAILSGKFVISLQGQKDPRLTWFFDLTQDYSQPGFLSFDILQSMVKRLPYKIFVDSFRHVPRVAVNLLLKKGGEFLLTKRAIPPEKGSWHLPGSFLLKGEKLLNCAKRVGKEELGFNIDAKKLKLLEIYDDTDKDIRGHIVDIVYGYQVEKNVTFKPGRDTEEVKFFHEIPKVVFAHAEILKDLGHE